MDGGDQKRAWSFRSWVSKICCISRMNQWIGLIFLHADTNLEKLKVTLIIIGWTWWKMGDALKIMGLLNQVYLTNDLMNWSDWLNDFSDGIIFYSTLHLWHVNAGVPLQLYLARVFQKISLCAKMTTKKGFFHLF